MLAPVGFLGGRGSSSIHITTHQGTLLDWKKQLLISGVFAAKIANWEPTRYGAGVPTPGAGDRQILREVAFLWGFF